MLKKLSNPGIVSAKEMYEDDQLIYIVLEYCEGPTLLDLLTQ